MEKGPSSEPVLARAPSRGLKGWLAAALTLVLLPASSGLWSPANSVRAQPPRPVLLQAAQALSSVDVRLATERPEYTLADPIRLVATLRNGSAQPAAVPVGKIAAAIKAALEPTLGPGVEVRAEGRGEILVPAGSALSAGFEIEVLGLPPGLAPGGEMAVRAGAIQFNHESGLVKLSDFEFRLKSVVQAGQPPQITGVSPWPTDPRLHLGTLALWLTLMGGAGFAIWLWRRPPRGQEETKPETPPPPPSVEVARLASQELDRLAQDLEKGLTPKEFYQRLSAALGAYLADTYRLGLPAAPALGSSQTLQEISEGLDHWKLTGYHRDGLGLIARHAQDTLYGGKEWDKAAQEEDLQRARQIINFAEMQTTGRLPRYWGASAFLPILGAVGGMHFGQPAWLLLLVPLFMYLLWKVLGPKRPEPAFAAPSKDLVVEKPSPLRRLAWLPSFLAYAALGLGIAGAADPRWGYSAHTRQVSSLDTLLVLDRSGSMEYKMRGAKRAAELLIDHQEGTTNRVGLIVFDNRAQLVEPLTTEYSALKASLNGVSAAGGTDIGAALDEAMLHFMEVSIIDSDEPGAQRLRKTLRQGDIWDAIEQAQREKLQGILIDRRIPHAIVLLSDGQSNNPATARQAVKRARDLGARIYTVAIPDADYDFMQEAARETGGKYFKADDQAGMERAFLHIDALEKKWAKAFSPPERQGHGRDFAQAAAWALIAAFLLRLGLMPEALRPPGRGALKGALLVVVLSGGALWPVVWLESGAARPESRVLAQAAPGARAPEGSWVEGLSPWREAEELREGTRLFREGKYKEAAEVYGKARRLYPDLPEAALYEGLARSQLEEREAAQESFEDAAAIARHQGRSDALAAALLEQGNAALQKGDAAAAQELYREALRLRPSGGPSEQQRLNKIQDAARKNYEQVLRQQPPPNGQGQSGEQGPPPPGGQGRPQPGGGRGQPQQGRDSQEQGEGQQDQSQNSDSKNRAQSKQGRQDQSKNSGDRSARPGGQGAGQTSGQEREAQAARALEELRRSGQGKAQDRRWDPIGRAWSFLPLPLLAVTDPGLSFGWTHPGFLYLAAIVPALFAVWALWAARRRLAQAKAWLQDAPSRLWAWPPARRFLLRAWAWAAALAFLLAAAAGPHWGTRTESFGYGGQDVVIGVDVSKSVLWEEHGSFEASLEGLDRVLRWLENGNAGDRIAIFPFAEEAGRTGLSHDQRVALLRLYRLRRDAMMLKEGSNLVAAVDRAIEIFGSAKDEGRRGRVFILISDGGETTEGLRAAAQRAKANDVTIHTLGVGTAQGGRMPVPQKYQEEVRSDYIRQGQAPVVVRRNEEALQALSRGTGGSYHPADGGRGMDRLLTQIAQEESQGHEGQLDVRRMLASPLLVPAVLLLAAGFLAGGAGRSKSETKRSQDRRAAIQETASRIRLSELLRGRFRIPYVSRSGTEQVDAVPLTDEPARLVDHKVSARTGELHAKRFKPNPDVPVYLVADVRRSQSASSQPESKRDVAADIGAALAFAAARENMRVGVFLISDRVVGMLPPRKGARQAEAVARFLREAPPGDGRDLGEALNAVLRSISRRGVMVLLSDYGADGYESALRAAADGHVLLPVQVEDVLESGPLPETGDVAVQDLETGRSAILRTQDPAVRDEVASRLAERRERLRRALAGRAYPPVVLANDGRHLERLVEYFQRKPWKR